MSIILVYVALLFNLVKGNAVMYFKW